MGNFTSATTTSELPKISVYLTAEEQTILRSLYTKISEKENLISTFDVGNRPEFKEDLVIFFELNIHNYDQFEAFIVQCTRSTSNKVVGTFWEMISRDTSRSTKEYLLRLFCVILELSFDNNVINDANKSEIASRMVDFVVIHFAICGLDILSSHETVTPVLMSTLNNYLPCTAKSLETYISRVCFQGLHSPSYKPFVPSTLDFPSEILGAHELLPLALHSETMQGAWKRLYSTSVDGLSFNRIVYHSLGYDGPTCVLIKCADPLGTVLGVLACDHWKESNRFYGSSKNTLFVLTPKLRIYPSKGGGSGAYQWLNSKSLTQPRGMGFGGTTDGFRIFIPESLEGCTAANNCPTYQTGKLIEGEKFEILTMEIWGCGGAEVVASALAAQAQDRAATDETIRRARQVDKAQFFNNDFDKEFLLSNTTSHASRERSGNS